jgi:hypothetical protein
MKYQLLLSTGIIIWLLVTAGCTGNTAAEITPVPSPLPAPSVNLLPSAPPESSPDIQNNELHPSFAITTSTVQALPTITVDELKHKLDNSNSLVLIDVRAPFDYQTSHIVNAISIPLEKLPERYSQIPPGTEVIVYSVCA